MDQECKEILCEISEKDWKQELEEFRITLLKKEAKSASKARNTSLSDWEESKLWGFNWEEFKPWGFLGTLSGFCTSFFISPESLFFTTLAAILIISSACIMSGGGPGAAAAAFLLIFGGLGSIGFFALLTALTPSYAQFFSILFCCALGFLFSLLLFQTLWGFMEKENQSELEEKWIEENQDFVLSPESLLQFWENQIHSYLHVRKTRVEQRKKISLEKRKECLELILELQSEKEKDQDTLIKLHRKTEEQNRICHETDFILNLIESLEKRFQEKIRELQELCLRQKELEAEIEKKKNIRLRVLKVLEDTKLDTLSWEKEKQALGIEIAGIVRAFQSQVEHTKDFITAQIELNQNLPELKNGQKLSS